MFVRNLEINMFVSAGKIWRFDAAGFNIVYRVGDWFLKDCWGTFLRTKNLRKMIPTLTCMFFQMSSSNHQLVLYRRTFFSTLNFVGLDNLLSKTVCQIGYEEGLLLMVKNCAPVRYKVYRSLID